MRVEIDDDEVWSVLSAVTRRVLDEAGLSEEDRGRLRRWRGDEMRQGREALKALNDKVNADLARSLKAKERGHIQKHDWV